jgi:hypothetical protein
MGPARKPIPKPLLALVFLASFARWAHAQNDRGADNAKIWAKAIGVLACGRNVTCTQR